MNGGKSLISQIMLPIHVLSIPTIKLLAKEAKCVGVFGQGNQWSPLKECLLTLLLELLFKFGYNLSLEQPITTESAALYSLWRNENKFN